MEESLSELIISKFSQWLLKSGPPRHSYLSDFHTIRKKIRPGDVLLVEGRTRVSKIIQVVTASPWTHAALYVGRFRDIDNPVVREVILQHLPKCKPLTRIIIESEIGQGTIVSSLAKYKEDHLRLLRPKGLSSANAQKVIIYAIDRVGKKYNVRHLLDLARFVFPYNLFPKRWRSSLFQHNAGQPTEDICSSMIADAFHSIQYPILPLIMANGKKNFELIQRNPRLFTPSDFDYSPFFDVIKYPIFKLSKNAALDHLPWKEGVISDDAGLIFTEFKETVTEVKVVIEGKEEKKDK